jgi:hypothetical protein
MRSRHCVSVFLLPPVVRDWPVIFMKSLLDDEHPADNLVLFFELIHPHFATETVIFSDLEG